MDLKNQIITARSLVKSFKDFQAVAGIDLHINQGECFGLLGPNGAGKSTFINLVYGASHRTSGHLSVFGLDPTSRGRDIKKRLGVVTQDNALDEGLTVFENMFIYSAFIGIPRREREKRVHELLEYMNLAHKKDAPIRTLSGGMKRRLVFVRALLGKPSLLILDEPTTGLDPAIRHLLWGKVKELHQNGTTILLTTHYMHEAEVLCDRLVIFNQGKVVAEGTPQGMIRQHAPGYVGLFGREDQARIQKIIHERSYPYQTYEDTSGFYVRTGTLEDLSAFHSKYHLIPLQIRPSHLEDVFLKLIGKEIGDDA